MEGDSVLEILQFLVPLAMSIFTLFQYYKLNKEKKLAEVRATQAEEKLKLAHAGKLDIEVDQMSFDLMKETIIFLRSQALQFKEELITTQNKLFETEAELEELKKDFKCEIRKINNENRSLRKLMKDLHGGVVALIEQLKCLDPEIVPVYNPPDLLDIIEDGLG